MVDKIKLWFAFVPQVWVSLILGWISALIGFTPFLKMDRAGALLICGAIVAEVFNDKKHRYFVQLAQPGTVTNYMYVEVDVPGENRKDIEVTIHQHSIGKTTVNTNPWMLYKLAKQQEFRAYGNTREWFLDRTMRRVEAVVDYSIIITTVVGTILWAFA